MEIATEDYFAYLARQADDMPLYLFDRDFAKRCPHLAQDYRVPRAFSEDLFSALQDARPDFRWLIIGPARSGSSFHVDPNATSAWNAAIRGRKKWCVPNPRGQVAARSALTAAACRILLPPHVVPPGVIPSADGANVATPVSIVEWFLNFYTECSQCESLVEGTVHPGEVIFVPRGWWHCVLNLDDSVAITQNFVSACNLPHVLAVLRSPNSQLVSGCEETSTLHARFLEAMRSQHPELAAECDRLDESAACAKQESAQLASLFSASAPRRDAEPSVPPGNGFSFSFAL